MAKKPFLMLVLLLGFVFIAGCSDDLGGYNNNPPKEDHINSLFCQYVTEEDFKSTEPLINDFLKKIEPNLGDKEKLEKLCEWLEKYDCILDVDLFCVSCIYTLPAHSEMDVTFSTDNGSITLILCISMSEPLVARWHLEHLE